PRRPGRARRERDRATEPGGQAGPAPGAAALSEREPWRASPENLTDEVRGSDGVPGGFGDVGPAGRSGPAEGPVGELVDFPLGVLLEPMVVTTLRADVAETGPAACFVRDVVVDVALGGRPAAHRAGAGRVPHLDQVLQPDTGIVTAGLVPVVAGVGGQRLQGEDQVRSRSGGAQPPDAGRAVPAGRGEREPGQVRRAGSGAFP